jgi:hypothetical protein
MTLTITTLSTTTFTIKSLRITIKNAKLSITSPSITMSIMLGVAYAKCDVFIFRLSVIMLDAIMLRVVAPKI